MFKSKPVLERAIELAKSKWFGSVDDLLIHLSMEGYSDLSEVKSSAVKAQLRELMKQRGAGRKVRSVWLFGVVIAIIVLGFAVLY